MYRFFLERGAMPGESVRFDAPVSRQMARVLRLAPGGRVVAVDPEGWELTVELTMVDSRGAEGRVIARQWRATEPPVRVVLAQGLPKSDKMDWVIQKGTEVGVAAFLPVVTRRTVVRPAGREAPRRERWQRIAREAAEQSGRTAVPRVAPISELAGVVDRLAEADLFLVPWEEEKGLSLKTVLRGAAAAGPAAGREGLFTVSFLVGPEGGLAPDEVALARDRGARPVTLGPRVLRTETAGLVAAAIILYELGDLGG